MWYSITLTVGIILLLIALFKLKESVSFLQKSEKAVATVIELDRVTDSDGDTYKPVFKFRTSHNQEITYRHFVSSKPSAWQVGEEATIAYDPGNPASAKLLTYFGTFSWSIILMAIAMPMIVIGGGYFLSQYFLK